MSVGPARQADLLALAACLREAGIAEFEGDIIGWGPVKLKMGALPSAPESPAAPVKPAPKHDAIALMSNRLFGDPLPEPESA